MGDRKFKKWSQCDSHLVESPVTVRVMIPRKVISYDPISFGPCRKEVTGGITPKRRHSQLKFFEGALPAPLGPPVHLPRLPPLSVGLPMSRCVCNSRSLKMAPIDRSHTSCYSSSIVTMVVSFIVFEIKRDIGRKNANFS